MRLNPQQAPLYGECVLTVQLDDDDVCHAEGEEEREEEVEFYLLFSGSTQRHLTSMVRVSHVTLQAVCPAHNACEQVLVTLCLARPGGPVDTPSQETFCFVQDLALDMAHFLLDSIAPQEALLLDDEQIPLKECERLDQSLALALKHLTLPYQRTGPGVDRQMFVTATDTHTPSGPERHDTETPEETCMGVSTLLDGCTAVSQCQQLSSLLHLAASHGLRTVATFLLQQPGGREALRRPNAQGLTAARLAESRGHQQLVELFTQYETSSNIQVEPKEQLHFYPEDRVFQHHTNLGTYTLTFLGHRQREGGAETQSSEDCCLEEEVKELRRRIHLHRDKKGTSDFAGTVVPTHDLVSPACGLQPCSNGLSVVTIETCSTATEGQGSPPSLEERAQGEDSGIVTHTSCTSGSLCQSQEAGGEQRGTPAANSPAGRNRKNRKRTTKSTRHPTESPGNNRSTPEADRGSAWRPATATGSKAETERSISPREPAVALIGDEGATNTQCGPKTEETPLPTKPVSAPGGDGKCAGRKAVALPTTTIVEKQEGEKWEVDVLICERVVETEAVRQTEEGDTERLPAKDDKVNVALEPAAERTVAMGQEQSQDPQESQSDPEEPSQHDTMNSSPQSGTRTSPKSPGTERKPRRGIWRDGSWIGSKMGSPPHGPETEAKTVWYQGENVDHSANEDWNREGMNSQTVWYDSDTTDQRKHEQLEQGMREQKECDLSSAQASGLSSPQLLEQGLSSHQLSPALSQPHAAGTQPALSHGPTAQRREVHGSQREEEVGPDWKEGGVERDREEVSNTETTYSRKSSETADVEEGGGEKQGSGEKGAKGRKKRRKKRGKRGGAEAKLSSSSSIESQSYIEIKTEREQVTNLNTQSDARDTTGRADVQSPTKDAMHLPSQTEGQTRDAHGPDCDVTDPSDTTPEFSPTDHGRTDLTEDAASQTLETKHDTSMNFHGPDHFNPDSTVPATELGQVDNRKADKEEITTVQPVEKEILDPTELELKASPVQQTVDNVESKALSENEDLLVAGKAVTSVDWTGLVESNCPKELPVKLSDPTEFTEDSFLVEFPEQNTHVQSAESNKPVQPVDPMGRPVGFMESVRPTEAVGLPFEGTADVLPLQIREGSAETTAREYLEHCSASETLRDQQHEEENELWVGEEEACEERSRSVEHDSDDEELSSTVGEQEQDYNEGIVATAVAVVVVAIASAMASIELSQRLAHSHSESRESLNQLPDDLLNTDQSSQLMNKDKESFQLLPAETESRPVEHSNIEPSDEQANVEISEDSDGVVLQCNTETEQLPAAQLSSNQQANIDPSAPVDTPSLPQPDKEEIQTETTQNKVFTCPLPPEEDNLLQANEMITPQVDSKGHMQIDIQFPVTEPGQHPEASDTHCPDSEEKPRLGDPQDQICQERSRIHHRHDGDDRHPAVGRQDSSKFKERESYEKAFRDVSDDPQLEGQVKTPCEGEIHTLPLTTCDSRLPVAPSDSTLVADPSPEEPTAPVNVETGEYQSSQSLLHMKLAVPLDAGSGTFQSKGHKDFATDNEDGVFGGMDKDSDALDTVDGWKEREMKKMKSEEEVTVDITSQTAAEEEECQQTSRDSDGTHTLQIQRERDVFCPEANTVTTCTGVCDLRTDGKKVLPAVHSDREECVSVCLLHRDKDSVNVSAQQDDSVFKKPKDPPPCVGHKDRGVRVSWSSTDDGLTQGALSPTEGALSVGTSDAVAPRSSRLSWKSETEDRGQFCSCF